MLVAVTSLVKFESLYVAPPQSLGPDDELGYALPTSLANVVGAETLAQWTAISKGAFLLWHFDAAPETLQELSAHGGDEDWLVLIPPSQVGRYFPLFESGSLTDHQTLYSFEDGWRMRIGAHA